MDKPVIGIVSKPKLSKHGWNLMYTNEHIKEAIISNGGLVIGIVPQGKAIGINENLDKYNYNLESNERNDFYTILSLCDGFVLEGGMTESTYEQEVAKYAYDKDIPILGICAGQGSQIKALGGTTEIIKNDNEFHNNYEQQYVHKVNLYKDSKIYNIIRKETIKVNSYHQYIPSTLGAYKASGISEDGLYEITELEDKLFNIGVRFHPELLFRNDENMNAIFKHFLNACITYKNNKI